MRNIPLPRLSYEDEPDLTDPFGVPSFTLVGSPIPARPPAPLGKSISSYLERYPPQLDDAVVVDIEVAPVRNCLDVRRGLIVRPNDPPWGDCDD